MGEARLADVVEEAVALAYRWAAVAGSAPGEGAAARRLAALVSDPAGLDLAVRFVDRVIRPEDPAVAARELAALAGRPGAFGFLSPLDRALLAAGRRAAPLAPAVVVPLARARLRALVGHLIVDSRRLGEHLESARRQGVRANLNLLGEAVLGEREAERRLAGTLRLIAAGASDVSVKLSALAPQLNAWDVPGEARRVAGRLRPVLEAATSAGTLVTLDMEEYRDLDLTLEVVTSLLAEPDLRGAPAGVAVQAYLPDALGALERLLSFARARCAAGGERLKVRLVKGANLALERVTAEVHGWSPAPYAGKAAVDANYLRLLDVVLRPDVTDSLRVGLAGHNVFDLAAGRLLAEARGVRSAVDVEMLHGMAPGLVRALRDDGAAVVLYTPVVAPGDLDAAVAYLIRRLEENAVPQNVLRALVGGADLGPHEAAFRAAARDLARPETTPRRAARTRMPPSGGAHAAFANSPDADPAVPATRSAAVAALAAPPVEPGIAVLAGPAAVEEVLAAARRAAVTWAALPPAGRAAVLRTAAAEFEARRTDLWSVLAHEAGKTVGEADPEVSEAADYARYYAERAVELTEVDGARFEPFPVVLVTPPWNFPLAIPMGSALAALAAGSAVVLKPAPQTPACARVAAGAVHAALRAHGLPAEVLQVVAADEGDVGRGLVAHRDVSAVVLTGSLATARLFASWRPERPLIAETSGKNAIVVTPAADLDLAVADIVRSAFSHAGQKCSAASLVIAVGSVATSARFRRQLTDAVASVRVGWPEDVGAWMGPLIERPGPKLRRALAALGDGETWLVEPRALDASGRLWSPGLKAGVRPGSFFHRTECFGPVLGLMSARDLDEAIELQNAVEYGLTGGLHSLDEAEVAHWLARVEVGNAYVNRHITGAIVGRQPFGGWKGSVVGPGAKAGGPNYVAQLGRWLPDGPPRRLATPAPHVLRRLERLAPLLAGAGEAEDLAWLRAAGGSDAHEWATGYGRETELAGLASESNVLRYRPLPALLVRAGAGARWAEVLRILLAAELAGTPALLSVHPVLVASLPRGSGAAGVLALRALAGLDPAIEDDDGAAARLLTGSAATRARVVGELPDQVAAAAARAGVSLLTGPVTASGRRELLAVLREQAVSRTRHRFGQFPPGAPRPPA